MSRLTNILLAGFFVFASPQISNPSIVFGGELDRREQPKQEIKNDENREWPLSIPQGTHIFDAWGGPTTELGVGNWNYSFDLPEIPAAVSTFLVEKLNPENFEWHYERVREKVDESITQEDERGRELFHLKFDTQFGSIASWAQGYTYSCVETLAVMTERGLRPLISVTESRHNKIGTKIRYDVFNREINQFGTFDYQTHDLIFPNNGEMYSVSERVMPDLHDALTLRVAMSEAKVRKDQGSADLGWIKDETLRSVVFSIVENDDKVLASVDLTSYGGVRQPITLTAHLVREEDTDLFHYPISETLELTTSIGHGTLYLRHN